MRVPGLVPSRYILAPLGVFFVMKTLGDEWYVDIKAYKLTVFDILRDFLYCHILHVRAIPTLECEHYASQYDSTQGVKSAVVCARRQRRMTM